MWMFCNKELCVVGDSIVYSGYWDDMRMRSDVWNRITNQSVGQYPWFFSFIRSLACFISSSFPLGLRRCWPTRTIHYFMPHLFVLTVDDDNHNERWLTLVVCANHILRIHRALLQFCVISSICFSLSICQTVVVQWRINECALHFLSIQWKNICSTNFRMNRMWFDETNAFFSLSSVVDHFNGKKNSPKKPSLALAVALTRGLKHITSYLFKFMLWMSIMC